MNLKDPLTEMRELKPLRDLPPAERQRLSVPRDGRSRPRVIAPAPVPEQDTYLDQVAELRDQAAAVDPVVTAASVREGSGEVLDQTLLEIARESAAIKFERMRAEREGRDASQLCSRRVSGLVQLASTIVARSRWEPDTLDVRCSQMQRVIAFFVETLKDAAEETLGADAARFMAEYDAKIAGWENRLDPPARGPAGDVDAK